MSNPKLYQKLIFAVWSCNSNIRKWVAAKNANVRIGPLGDQCYASAATSTSALFHRFAKLVRLRQAVCEPSGIGAVAAPIRQLLHRHALIAARGILPRKPGFGIEHRDVR